MDFLDEQGVGPCGHAAKEKGILVEVFASCLSIETPLEMAFSIHSVENDKNTGSLAFITNLRCKHIHEGQHPSALNFTVVRCKNSISEPCTMAPGSTWQRWSIGKRVWLIRSSNNIQPEWCYLLLANDEKTIIAVIDKENIPGNVEDYGQVLKSGWGREPPNEVRDWIEKSYQINYNSTS